jgi:hypothetical protein
MHAAEVDMNKTKEGTVVANTAQSMSAGHLWAYLADSESRTDQSRYQTCKSPGRTENRCTGGIVAL